MHFHLEIIMPHTENLEAEISRILAPFDEGSEESRNAFWDWYQIGGRWTGTKDGFDPASDENNVERCEICQGTGFRADEVGKRAREAEATYTCNGCGKWNEGGKWTHSEFGAGKRLKWPTAWAQYKGDIMPLRDVKKDQKAFRVIIAGMNHAGTGMEAVFMACRENWNGVSFDESSWDGTIESALEKHRDRAKNYRAEYAERITPTDEWIAVSIDYHC